MDEMKYKAAVDSVKFSESFEQDTIGYLMRAVTSQKENGYLKTHRLLKAALIAALAVVLSVSAYAAWKLLTPAEVASHGEDRTLVEAFNSKDAISINESVQTGDYTITLAGIVSGKGLTDSALIHNGIIQEDRSYVVVSVAYSDGREISQDTDSEDTIYGDLTVTPLVAGYRPWRLNAWSLCGAGTYFIDEGVLYFLLDFSNIEIFADHTIYIAVYAHSCGFMAPCTQLFRMEENGDISYVEGITAPHALFTLPIDPSKADPDAVNGLFESLGIKDLITE